MARRPCPRLPLPPSALPSLSPRPSPPPSSLPAGRRPPSSSRPAAAPVPPHASPQTLPHPSIQPAAPLSSNQSSCGARTTCSAKGLTGGGGAGGGEDVRGEAGRAAGDGALRQDHGAAQEAQLRAQPGALRPRARRAEGLRGGVEGRHLQPARRARRRDRRGHDRLLPDYASLAARIAVSNLHKNTKKSFSETIKDMYGHYNERSGLMAPLIADDVYEVIMKLSSRFLICMKDDSIDGIYDTLKECAVISKSAGGIGVSVHNIRATGSYIRGTNGTSNGIVPMF